jgi:hypothetical protein
LLHVQEIAGQSADFWQLPPLPPLPPPLPPLDEDWPDDEPDPEEEPLLEDEPPPDEEPPPPPPPPPPEPPLHATTEAKTTDNPIKRTMGAPFAGRRHVSGYTASVSKSG